MKVKGINKLYDVEIKKIVLQKRMCDSYCWKFYDWNDFCNN